MELRNLVEVAYGYELERDFFGIRIPNVLLHVPWNGQQNYVNINDFIEKEDTKGVITTAFYTNPHKQDQIDLLIGVDSEEDYKVDRHYEYVKQFYKKVMGHIGKVINSKGSDIQKKVYKAYKDSAELKHYKVSIGYYS